MRLVVIIGDNIDASEIHCKIYEGGAEVYDKLTIHWRNKKIASLKLLSPIDLAGYLSGYLAALLKNEKHN